MDDPQFDPFFDPSFDSGSESRFEPRGVDAGHVDEPRSPVRWRPPSKPAPHAPPAPPVIEHSGTHAAGPEAPPPTSVRRPQHPPRARLAGTAGFLRTLAVPRLERFAARLQLARHEATVEDQLDTASPTVRFRARLHRGPWATHEATAAGVLELSVPAAALGSIRVRTWLGDEGSEPHSDLSFPPARLDGRTVERLALTLLEDLVDRS